MQYLGGKNRESKAIKEVVNPFGVMQASLGNSHHLAVKSNKRDVRDKAYGLSFESGDCPANFNPGQLRDRRQ